MTCPYITAALTATSSTTFSQPPLTPPSGEVGIDIFPEMYCKKNSVAYKYVKIRHRV